MLDPEAFDCCIGVITFARYLFSVSDIILVLGHLRLFEIGLHVVVNVIGPLPC